MLFCSVPNDSVVWPQREHVALMPLTGRPSSSSNSICSISQRTFIFHRSCSVLSIIVRVTMQPTDPPNDQVKIILPTILGIVDNKTIGLHP